MGLPLSQRPSGIQTPPLWSRNFCELALNQWTNSHGSQADREPYVLFHAIHVNILVNLAALQDAATAWLHGYTNQSSRVHITPPDHIFLFRGERTKAVWHANQILRLAVADDYALSKNSFGTTRSHAPHFSHCVCVAALVLWYNTLLAEGETAARQWPMVAVAALQSHTAAANGPFRTLLKELIVGVHD